MHVCFEREFETKAYALQNITSKIADLVSQTGIWTGLCTVFIAHTSASLLIQENADPDVLLDLESFFKKLVPEGRSYRHDAEGPDDMPAHIRSALTQSSIGIPVVSGHLVLGAWQGIFLWEHRSRPHRRKIVISISGVTAGQSSTEF